VLVRVGLNARDAVVGLGLRSVDAVVCLREIALQTTDAFLASASTRASASDCSLIAHGQAPFRCPLAGDAALNVPQT
jgi:hypothetical protein